MMGHPLRIGWITPTVGVFGAVREMVEVSNVWVNLGATVTLFHPDGTPVVWLDNQLHTAPLADLIRADLDILIGVVDWQPDLYHNLIEASAQFKAICLLGFAPTIEMAQALRGEIAPRDRAEKMIVDAMGRGYGIFTDSQWQIDWVKTQTGYPAGPAFGGINSAMFRPGPAQSSHARTRIVYANDPRERKGSDTVNAALAELEKLYPKQLEIEFYWYKRFNQTQLVEFLQSADIFLDGHRRAGWCNPVLEAMACGAVPVCTRIGATQEFALPDETALVVDVDDVGGMVAATRTLIDDPGLRARLRQCGIKKACEFDYAKVGKRVYQYLQDKYDA